MIYFHNNKQIVYLTHVGIEKIFEIVRTPHEGRGRRKKDTITLKEISNMFYNDTSLVRRFLIDNTSFSNNFATAIDKTDILRFRAEILKRHLMMNIYLTTDTDVHKDYISRFREQDQNVNSFSYFLINNYRRELSFNYLSWKIIYALGMKTVNL